MSSDGVGDADQRASEWEQRYAQGRTGWDLGVEAPSLGRWLRENTIAPGTRVLVPGAGRGHDARAWARAGASVTAVDFAASALVAAAQLARAHGLEIEFVNADVISLPDAWTDRFDIIWEQTCLCAIAPELREPYIAQWARVLAPGGTVHALLWAHGRESGPPWDMDDATVGPLVRAHFESVEVHPVTNSVAMRRAGAEGAGVGERWWTLRDVRTP